MSGFSTTFWKWFAIVLVALNTGLLAFMLSGPGHKSGPPERRQAPEGPARFIIEKLRFNREQEAAFLKLKQAHRDSVEAIQEQGHKLRHEFFEGLKQDAADPAATEQLARQIAANQQRIELVTYRHFEEVKKLCDPKQKAIFKEIIQEVLMRMAPRHGPPPPGHP